MSPGGPSTSRRRELVTEVLDQVADSVVGKTPFQRVIATCYSSPLHPGSRQPVATVRGLAARGLSEVDLQVLNRLIDDGAPISGLRYQETARIGRSYLFDSSERAAFLSHVIPSRRRYLSQRGWSQADALLIPFWASEEVIGQISVDDPRDGRVPDTALLLRLEEIASAASLALRDANALEDLTESHRLFRSLTDGGMAGIVVIRDGRITYSNRQTEALLGYDGDSLRRLAPWWGFLHPDDRPFAWDCAGNGGSGPQTLRAVRRDGRIVWCTARASRMPSEGGEAIVLELFDITERIETEMQLREKALHDPLTGLWNRAYFEEAIRLETFRCRRYRRPFTLMIADLRNFKRLNDTLGHQEGDRILAGVAELMQSQLRESDWMVRYGGDEFLLVLPETGQDLRPLVERLDRSASIWARENVRGGLPFGIDFGWSTWTPDAPASLTDLLKSADDMLYERKRANHLDATA